MIIMIRAMMKAIGSKLSGIGDIVFGWRIDGLSLWVGFVVGLMGLIDGFDLWV